MKQAVRTHGSRNDIVNQSWIEHFFVVLWQRPKDKSSEEFLDYLEQKNHEVLGHVLVHAAGIEKVGKSVSIKSFSIDSLPDEYVRALRFREIDDNSYVMIVRFPDVRKRDLNTKTLILRHIRENETRKYTFTPEQSIAVPEICKSVEWVLYKTLGIKPHKLMTLITGTGDEIIIHDLDGLQYVSYPLSKRAQLFLADPKLDKKIFRMNFIKFAKWIISKEKDSDDMKRNADRTRKILLRHKIAI